jgi:copper transport protein
VFEDALRNIAFAIVRFSNYVSGALLFGLAVITLLVIRPSLARYLEGRGRSARARMAYRLGKLVTISIVVSAAATLIGLLLQSLLIADLSGGDVSLDDLSSVLDSSFGRWNALRLPLLLALAVLLGGRIQFRVIAGAGDDSRSPPSFWWAAWTLLSLGILITSAMSGHAAVSSPAAVAVANDIVHLAAGSIWFSGIVVLAVVIPDAGRRLEETDRLRLLAPMVVDFSRVALVSIGVIGVAGTINSFFNVKNVSDLFDSGYGRALTVKIALYLVILVLGGINHFYVRSRLEAALREDRSDRSAGIFRRIIAFELAVGVAVLALSAVLAGSARTRQYISVGETPAQGEPAEKAR